MMLHLNQRILIALTFALVGPYVGSLPAWFHVFATSDAPIKAASSLILASAALSPIAYVLGLAPATVSGVIAAAGAHLPTTRLQYAAASAVVGGVVSALWAALLPLDAVRELVTGGLTAGLACGLATSGMRRGPKPQRAPRLRPLDLTL